MLLFLIEFLKVFGENQRNQSKKSDWFFILGIDI